MRQIFCTSITQIEKLRVNSLSRVTGKRWQSQGSQAADHPHPASRSSGRCPVVCFLLRNVAQTAAVDGQVLM